MAFEKQLEELTRRRARALEMGGSEKVQRQHDRGSLTARERIDRLLDPGSFLEIGMFNHSDMPGMEDKTPADFTRTGDNTRLAVLMPGRSVSLKYSLLCPRRGYHRIGPLLMESGDLFGLQKRFRTGEQQDYVSVLPAVAYIDTFNVAARNRITPSRRAAGSRRCARRCIDRLQDEMQPGHGRSSRLKAHAAPALGRSTAGDRTEIPRGDSTRRPWESSGSGLENAALGAALSALLSRCC